MSERQKNLSKREIATTAALVYGLECLRARIVDLEAVAHAAAATLEHMPYFARAAVSASAHSPDAPAPDAAPASGRDVRQHMDRLQTFVHSTAETANQVLKEANALLERVRAKAGHGQPDGSSSAGESWRLYYQQLNQGRARPVRRLPGQKNARSRVTQ